MGKETVKIDFKEERVFLIVDGQTMKNMTFEEYYNDYKKLGDNIVSDIIKKRFIKKVEEQMEKKGINPDDYLKYRKKIGKFKDFLDL